MAQYIDKSALVAEIEKRINGLKDCHADMVAGYAGEISGLERLLSFINTLEVKDPYEQCIQYPSIKDGIKAHAETYSFNIESELFNQLTKEQQKLWRKEIEQACISGGNAGVGLARDIRYKESLKVKEVNLEKEYKDFVEEDPVYNKLVNSIVGKAIAKHFFELGISLNNPITAADRGTAEEIIINLKRVEQDYHIDLTKEIEWVGNKVKKGE